MKEVLESVLAAEFVATVRPGRAGEPPVWVEWHPTSAQHTLTATQTAAALRHVAQVIEAQGLL
ncbi:hypothetical protein [Nocardia cyriacigeorgica]|uniref:Uncharacterized protein n=1 Tax=Nocardia cyriacigeorgica TaxID=135487 RepID=A0A5R8NB77_9NOCA|nr:hypothetical protein [Nocardia cyriacigeorgica]TLF72886.1 hypothetical protein FEK34_28090 [Nocardia cyriacigeorgica]